VKKINKYILRYHLYEFYETAPSSPDGAMCVCVCVCVCERERERERERRGRRRERDKEKEKERERGRLIPWDLENFI
jgi:hypothetical protein